MAISDRDPKQAKQLLLRNFSKKVSGIAAGRTQAILQTMSQQPPDGYEYRGTAFNGEEIFTDGNGGYFFPRKFCAAGDILYIREEWSIAFSDDGSPEFAYKADGNGSGRLWKAASYMPLEAARFFLQVESTSLSRIQDITIKDAKALGFGGRGWKKELEAAWNADLRKPEIPGLCYGDGNPWVQIIRFRRCDPPVGWPTGIDDRILDYGTDYKRYTIRLADTGEIVAEGTADECAKAMGYKSPRMVYRLIVNIHRRKNRMYTVESN